MKKEKFYITGMTCSSCSAHVEKAVKNLSGMKKVNVNLLSNNMLIEYDETKLNVSDVINAVNEAGYGASLSDKKEIVDKKDNLDIMKKRFIVSICFLIPLMYISMHHMLNELFGLPIFQIVQKLFDGNKNSITSAFTQFLLLLPILYVNRDFFIIGFKRLAKKSPNMDTLIAIGASASTLYGIFAIFMIGYGLGYGDDSLVEKYSMDIYFESAGTILTLITLGKYLEGKSKKKTGEAINKLMNLVPNTAIVLRENEEVEIKTENIVLNDIVVIKPGSSIPVDGEVLEGRCTIDESSITGESIPVEKNIGDKLISGCINKNGYVKMKATKIGEDTTLSQIIKLVEEASNSKAPISKLADKVSGIFVPIVLLISIVSFVFWILNGQSLEEALSFAIAVLVISCPCALGLATPVAIMVGTGVGAKNGILIKSAESLELLHKVDTVILDKTGTITVGKPRVTDIISYIDEEELLKIAGGLEKKSEHPLSDSIMKKVENEKIQIYDVDEFSSVVGRGIKAKINGKIYFGGNIAFMEENNILIKDNMLEDSKKLLSKGKTVLYFADIKSVIGMIAVADVIKPDSYRAIQELKNRHIDIYMVTGDNKIVAENVGNKLGIKNVVSEVLPKDKQLEVSKLQSKGKKVAFIGDGINDSPALSLSDVGIAIGTGTDIATKSADVILMRSSLNDVITAIDLSKAVVNNIKLNLFWAFFYNVIGIPVAAGVFYLSFGLRLSPMIGALAMSLSSVCVVTNALRLNKFKPNIKEENEMNKEEKIIYIDGMQCNHCKMAVTSALEKIEGVDYVDVNLESKSALVKLNKEISDDDFKQIIKDAGYTVKEIK